VTVSIRPRVAVALLVLLAPVLTACSTNFSAPTEQFYNPGRGTNERSGDIKVLGAVIVSGAAGSGTLSATLVNTGDDEDTLSAVSVDGEAGTIKAGAESTELTPSTPLDLAKEGSVTVTGDAIEAGRYVELTLEFENADSVTFEVPVVSNTGDYEDVPVESTEE
jgi:hypothetical protein